MNSSCIALKSSRIGTQCASTHPHTRPSTHPHTRRKQQSDMVERESLNPIEGLGKEKGLEVSFKQRKCRCVTQIDRQGVPERRCRKTERAVTNSLHVSFGDSKQFFARSTKSAGGIVGAKCIGQIGWESSIKVAVGQSRHFVLTPKLHWQPVQFLEHGCHVLALSSLQN